MQLVVNHVDNFWHTFTLILQALENPRRQKIRGLKPLVQSRGFEVFILQFKHIKVISLVQPYAAWLVFQAHLKDLNENYIWVVVKHI